MKLLIIGPDIQDLSKVKNFTGVQAYYLMRELRASGVELVFANGKHPRPLEYLAEVDTQGADHVLALGLRWFTHQPEGCAAILKQRVPGAVTQLHDGVVHSYLAGHMEGVDCTFMFRDDSTRLKNWERYAEKNHYIGWAADGGLLFPAQNERQLCILIDHLYYKQGQPDLTDAVTADVMAFANSDEWRGRWHSVRVRRLVNGGAEDVIDTAPIKPFERRHIPFPEIAREYRKAHLYMVTHKESVGLTCLELAYCGALPVVPEGLIYKDRLETFRHVEYSGFPAPWSEVLSSIDTDASALRAREQTWPAVADRLLGWFE
jgi:hypothetical protein